MWSFPYIPKQEVGHWHPKDPLLRRGTLGCQKTWRANNLGRERGKEKGKGKGEGEGEGEGSLLKWNRNRSSVYSTKHTPLTKLFFLTFAPEEVLKLFFSRGGSHCGAKINPRTSSSHLTDVIGLARPSTITI